MINFQIVAVLLCGAATVFSIDNVVLFGQNSRFPIFDLSAPRSIGALTSGASTTSFSELSFSYSTPSCLALSFYGDGGEASIFGTSFSYESIGASRLADGSFSFAAATGKYSFGLAARILGGRASGGEPLFNMDIDGGCAYSEPGLLTVSLSVAGFLASPLLVSESLIVNVNRSAKAEIEAIVDSKDRLRIFASYAMDSLNAWNMERISYAAGIRLSPKISAPLSLSAGYYAGRKDESKGFASAILAGISIALHQNNNQFVLGYSGSFPVAGTRIDGISTVSVSYRFGVATDRKAPNVALRVSGSTLVRGTGEYSKLQLYLEADDHDGRPVKQWSLLIGSDGGNNKLIPVKSWTGTGVPPRLVEWDGRDGLGEVVGAGRYCVRLHAEDFSKNTSVTPCFEVVVQ